MKLRTTLSLACLIGLLWSVPMACRMNRQQHRSTQSERHLLHTDHRQYLQHHRSVADSRGYRFYLLTDSPFFFHADSGLYARSGLLLIDQQEQRHQQDSLTDHGQERITAESAYQAKEDEQTRIMTSYPGMSWRAWLVLLLLGAWFVWLGWRRLR